MKKRPVPRSVFSVFRNSFGQWDPEKPAPRAVEHLSTARRRWASTSGSFPISNWTELDVWQYIALEGIDMPSLYFSHKREIVRRDGTILALGDYNQLEDGEQAEKVEVRFRTIGDMTCTGGLESPARSVEDIIQEIAATRTTERGGRADDKRSEAAMEDRKKMGYF